MSLVQAHRQATAVYDSRMNPGYQSYLDISGGVTPTRDVYTREHPNQGSTTKLQHQADQHVKSSAFRKPPKSVDRSGS